MHGISAVNIKKLVRRVFSLVVLLSLITYQSCDKEDPTPLNEEEVITTVKITQTPEGNGDAVTLTFFDADGPLGNIEPTIISSGPLTSATMYAVVIALANETLTPAVNISEEVAGEADEHLFCFDATGDIVITYEDEDENGLPLGLLTTWVTGTPGAAEVTVTLRHQAGTKTGQCPGTGETDVEISFPLVVE